MLLRNDIKTSFSLLDNIKKTHKALNGNRKEYYAIPESRQMVAQNIFFFTMGLPQGMDINNMMSVDRSRLRMVNGWTQENTREQIQSTREIVKMGEALELDVRVGGKMPIYMNLNDLVVHDLFASIAMTFGILCLVIFIVFRKLKLVFCGMLVNMIPLIFGAGFMVLTDRYLDVGSVLIFSICLGIAVDDTIHLISNYKDARDSGDDARAALDSTFLYTGKALILTTVILVIGFGLFIFGSFVPNQSFGILVAFILAGALLTDLVLLPGVLLAFDKEK